MYLSNKPAGAHNVGRGVAPLACLYRDKKFESNCRFNIPKDLGLQGNSLQIHT